MAAQPSQRSQSNSFGTASWAGMDCTPWGQLGELVTACTSVTLPISPDQTISQAVLWPSCEYPWLPICVATLYLAAASASRRASHGVLVNGFSTYTCFPRSMHQSATVACMWSAVEITT